MTIWFQQRFAPIRYREQGTADHWSPYWQTVIVRKVVTGRDRHGVKRYPAYGWSQWGTAPLCGL